MEFHSDILYQFLQDLVESYRQQIMEQEDVKELTEKQKKLSVMINEKIGQPYPELYQLVTKYTGSIYDISGIEQEELYIQGIKDGLRIAKLIGKAEEGESC